MRRSVKRFLQCFDRSFYKGNWTQYIWLSGIMGAAFLVCAGLAACFDVNLWRVVELMLDPGSFVDSYEDGQAWVNFFVTITGAVVFTSFIINVIGNSLGRRMEAFGHGRVTYRFENHVLILGSNAMMVNLVRSLIKDPVNKGRDIVIFTNRNAEKVRDYLFSRIPEAEEGNVFVLYGDRTLASSLTRVEAQDAESIYILGEDGEDMHDALNLECWSSLKKVCGCAQHPISCYLVLERLSSERVFFYKSDSGSCGNLRLTVINELENAAQRVFVSRDYEDGILYPALDREGITKDSIQNVHLVIVGMTQVAYAMAMAAAHVCHFPNFRSAGKRTKITFISNNIRQEMEFFRGRFSSLMALSYSRYVKWDSNGKEDFTEYKPDVRYSGPYCSDENGFLDVEWEFLDGGIESDNIRKYLVGAAERDGRDEYLSIAVCGLDPEANVSAALYLPSEVYDKKIPIFVYQRSSGEILKTAKRSDRFGHIYPFGMKGDCYDIQYRERLKRAKRISYLYGHTYDYVSMPADGSMEESWFDMQYAFQQSNLYSANSIPTKLRSVGIGPDMTGKSLSDDDVEILSEVEHNRWNMERLLVGFKAMPSEERIALKARFESEDADVRKAVKAEHDEMKKKEFRNKDIAPYDELLEGSKDFDRTIVRNIMDVMR